MTDDQLPSEANDTIERFDGLTRKASQYHQRAQWQEKLRTLEEMLDLTDQPGFLEAESKKQQVLYEIGGVWRRFGRYENAESTLQQILVRFPHASPTQRAQVLGELGVVFRHVNQYERALESFREQCRLGGQAIFEAQAEVCRAVGNEGMTAYNIAQQSQLPDGDLLGMAIDLLQERVEKARQLRRDLLRKDPTSKYIYLARSWEAIGLDRLSLCYVAVGDTNKAVNLAEESQSLDKG